MTKDNKNLGTFNLEGIPPAPRGTPKIEVTFDIDVNGILNVSAKETATGNVKNIQIKNDMENMSQEELDRLVKEAEIMKDQDEQMAKRVNGKNELDAYCYQIKQTLENQELKNKYPQEVENLLEKVKETTTWLENNANAELYEIEAKKEELTKAYQPLSQRIYSQ